MPIDERSPQEDPRAAGGPRFSAHGEELELRTTAVPDAVAEVRHAAVAFAERCGAPPAVRRAIGLSVSEAATNAVVHAYAGLREPGPVELRLRRAADEIVVIVADEGRGIRPRPDSPGIGMGLTTIARLADRLTVAHGAGRRGARVEMRFAIREEPREGAAQIAPRQDAIRPPVVRADLEQEAAGPSVE